MTQSTNETNKEEIVPITPTPIVGTFIQTIEFIPTFKPQSFSEQLLIVTSGGSSRTYIYDTKFTGGGWRYFTLT